MPRELTAHTAALPVGAQDKKTRPAASRAVFEIEPGATQVTNLLTSSSPIVPDDSQGHLCADVHMLSVGVGQAARLDEEYIGSVYPDELAELRQRVALLEAEAATTRRGLQSLRGRMDSVEVGT